ncbi:virulence-associated E family protein, partial [Bacteroides uniformis]
LFTLTEFALVCLEELEEMTSAQVSQLKAITGMTDVNERAAYGHFKESRPHIASFCGTSNNVTFLNDLSGNRRWLPFEVDSIDSPFDYPIDYARV